MRLYKTTLQKKKKKKKEFFSRDQFYTVKYPTICIFAHFSPRCLHMSWVTFHQLTAYLLNLQEYPVQGRFLVRQYYLHFQMIAFLIVMGICSLESFKYAIPWLWRSILNLQISCEWSFDFAIVKTFEHINQKFNIHSKYHTFKLSIIVCSVLWLVKKNLQINSITNCKLYCFVIISECVQNLSPTYIINLHINFVHRQKFLISV